MKNSTRMIFAVLVLAVFSTVSTVYAGKAVYTTIEDGTAVNFNVYAVNADVYISGGPQNTNTAGLPDGTYYFQVTDPSGKNVLSTDVVSCRKLTVAGRVITATFASAPCSTGAHAIGAFNPANGSTTVQLMPFSVTPNAGGVYKVWVSKDNKFPPLNSKTDNFKVLPGVVVTGSCAPSSSLSILVTGTNVASYVPKGSWSGSTTGVSVVNVEGTSTLPTTNPIPTASVVNSCASNPTFPTSSGETVCTANNTDAYVIPGGTLTPTVTTLTSGGSGTIFFSGGSCTNCGVAMDATNNKAVIGLSIAGSPGFQFLNLATNLFEVPPIPSPAGIISEDPLIDPIRNLLLSADENGNYEIANVATTTAPLFYENATSGGFLDSSGEDCSTGIALAPAEFSGPSSVFIANLQSSSATFAAGLWTAPSQNQSLSESFLSAGASGIAVAQGTHIGIVSGEFGGDAITAIQLPTAPDTTATIPAISDWITCSIGSGFSNGLDPHAVTAYQSPNSGHAIAALADPGTTVLAVVDLTNMLNTVTVPRTVGGHGCASGTLPGTVVSFIAVP